jgi:hypothetical protein
MSYQMNAEQLGQNGIDASEKQITMQSLSRTSLARRRRCRRARGLLRRRPMGTRGPRGTGALGEGGRAGREGRLWIWLTGTRERGLRRTSSRRRRRRRGLLRCRAGHTD